MTLEAKKKRTEEDSVSCPMKYSTDVECRSDSLAVISYRDINQFTYVNLSSGYYRYDGRLAACSGDDEAVVCRHVGRRGLVIALVKSALRALLK